MEEDIIIAKYHDKNGIKIEIKKLIDRDPWKVDYYGDFIYVEVKVFKKEYYNFLVPIDYCIPECLNWLFDMLFSLKKYKKTKVARRWILKNIKNLEFGNTGKRVNDFFKDGNIDFDRGEFEYKKYCNSKNDNTKI